ncbi:flavodoxin family protein [Campylobacter sp. 9BO]|uniref:flavodoxin family protein n=1 Tax=Campylobacter sp. 9BO TaxID=3424759 RepID=UPI003D345424
MKKIVIYSSQTGNTKKVGEAIADELGCEAVSFESKKAQNLSEFDFIALGYYIDKGGPDSKFKRFIKENIKDKRVGLFITLGAEPDGEHGAHMLNGGKVLLEENGCEVLREFICQGAISDEVMQQMREMVEKMGDKAMHQITPERLARWEASKSHPDENDLANARKAFAGI